MNHGTQLCMLLAAADEAFDRRGGKKDSVRVWKTSLPHSVARKLCFHVRMWSRRHGGDCDSGQTGSAERARASSKVRGKAGGAFVTSCGSGDPLRAGNGSSDFGPSAWGRAQSQGRLVPAGERRLGARPRGFLRSQGQKLRRGTGAFPARARHWECWEPVAFACMLAGCCSVPSLRIFFKKGLKKN
jgi:hypothetical protein